MAATYTIKGFSEDEYRQVRILAATDGVSINQWLLALIRRELAAKAAEKTSN